MQYKIQLAAGPIGQYKGAPAPVIAPPTELYTYLPAQCGLQYLRRKKMYFIVSVGKRNIKFNYEKCVGIGKKVSSNRKYSM